MTTESNNSSQHLNTIRTMKVRGSSMLFREEASSQSIVSRVAQAPCREQVHRIYLGLLRQDSRSSMQHPWEHQLITKYPSEEPVDLGRCLLRVQVLYTSLNLSYPTVRSQVQRVANHNHANQALSLGLSWLGILCTGMFKQCKPEMTSMDRASTSPITYLQAT